MAFFQLSSVGSARTWSYTSNGRSTWPCKEDSTFQKTCTVYIRNQCEGQNKTFSPHCFHWGQIGHVGISEDANFASLHVLQVHSDFCCYPFTKAQIGRSDLTDLYMKIQVNLTKVNSLQRHILFRPSQQG